MNLGGGQCITNLASFLNLSFLNSQLSVAMPHTLTWHNVYKSVPGLVDLKLPNASRLLLVQLGAVLLQELELVVDVALP